MMAPNDMPSLVWCWEPVGHSDLCSDHAHLMTELISNHTPTTPLCFQALADFFLKTPFNF